MLIYWGGDCFYVGRTQSKPDLSLLVKGVEEVQEGPVVEERKLAPALVARALHAQRNRDG
jgi:hypothetical protein